MFRLQPEQRSKILYRRWAPKGGPGLDTVGDVDAGAGDLLEKFQAASSELTQLGSVADVAEAALGLALRLTRSSVAFLALDDESTGFKQLFSRAADPLDAMPQDEIERLFAAARAVSGPLDNSTWTSMSMPSSPAIRSYCGRPLETGGRRIGMIGVASATGYTALQAAAFAIFANQVAATLDAARTAERRQEMVDTLINLRSELDRSERQRLVNEERAKSVERVEHAHEAIVAALLAVSRHARSGHGLPDFYRRLTRSIAELVGARKVLFWQLDGDGFLKPIAGAYGVDDGFIESLYPAPCAPDGDDLASRVVYHDLMFRASRADQSGDFQHVLDRLHVENAISVPWRAGDQRLGLVAAYDSRRADGFSREDTWVLQKAGLAAGLVWQLKYAETDLKKTVERLERVDAARQLLLKNVTTAVERARKRFAGELHDDALQKLTAAELQLQRLVDSPNGYDGAGLAETQELLTQTEEALRRLLFEVRPPALEVAGGFAQTLEDRIALVRSHTGAEVEFELDVPDELSYEYRSMLFRQVTEALTNIEKHAAAKKVRVSLRREDEGVHGLVEDDGRGFVVAERDRLPGHLGLVALGERALLAGGWNRIESEPDRGTKVEFWMPFDDRA
ncbi:MAG TPA: GAF domain-containing protein [Candidatus Udaeobacter sp.]|nr:GAF domain-containing protein [Candidatus Udaeobacter sp.]